jgi:hypothetical protein
MNDPSAGMAAQQPVARAAASQASPSSGSGQDLLSDVQTLDSAPSPVSDEIAGGGAATGAQGTTTLPRTSTTVDRGGSGSTSSVVSSASSSTSSSTSLPSVSTSSTTTSTSQNSGSPANLHILNVPVNSSLRELIESGGSGTGRGSAVADATTGSVLLSEGNSFLVMARYHYTIPQHPGKLMFSYQELVLNSPQDGKIRDAFEAAFLDGAGRSLVPTFTTGRDSFLNLTEGMDIAKASGVVADTTSSSGTITLDISNIAPGTQATLVLRLVEGFSGPEIAERTGLTPASVRVNLHRGMKLLRYKLQP